MLWVSRLRSHEHECPTYLKSIRKSKALATTLSDIEPEDDSNNEDDGILSTFIATINPTNGIVEDVVEEEELVESKFELKMTSIQPMRNYISFLRSMRNCIS